MDSSVFAPLKETLNNLAGQLVLLMVIWGVAYCIVWWVLSKLKVPKAITKFLSGLALLGIMYYTIQYQLIPGFQHGFWQ